MGTVDVVIAKEKEAEELIKAASEERRKAISDASERAGAIMEETKAKAKEIREKGEKEAASGGEGARENIRAQIEENAKDLIKAGSKKKTDTVEAILEILKENLRSWL